MSLNRHRVLLLALAGLAPWAGPAQGAARLAGHLEVARSAVGERDDAVVRFTLTNEGEERARLPVWQTPLLGVEGNLFVVGWNGRRVAYLGPLVKRAAPTADDYVTLEPGRSLVAEVELSAVYDLGLPGEYTIQFRAALGERGPFDRAGEVASNVVSLFRDGDLGEALKRRAREAALAPAAPPESADQAGTPRYVGCSADRQSALALAVRQARAYAADASRYLLAGAAGSRYTTWFGDFREARWSTAERHLFDIRGTLFHRRLTFDCSCLNSAFAYVFPNIPYVIHLCAGFWSAPTAGTDSQGGTLVHELSHFYLVARTDDWVYGQEACRALAEAHPARALDNADSHEYFAENHPAGT